MKDQQKLLGNWRTVLEVDYRYKDGRFPLTASWVTSSNPQFTFQQLKKELILKYEAQRKKKLNWLCSTSESNWWYLYIPQRSEELTRLYKLV
jgi:hypothetical protein